MKKISGLEGLLQNKHLDPKSLDKIIPKKFGSFGLVETGATTFNILSKFYDINKNACKVFTPKSWDAPNVLQRRADSLVVKGNTIVCVVEHKTLGTLSKKKERDGAIEQCYAYMLITRSTLGLVTDGNRNIWLHDIDSNRPNQIKIISDESGEFAGDLHPTTIQKILNLIEPESDILGSPLEINPSQVAKSVWQSVYIATRQSPEKCFQTFVELFMYKLMSDYELIPKMHRIDEITVTLP